MIRADEAVQKEHHAAAVNELQSRVEDWKGHKINHFGELLHFGNYTVLKGEGAKVVEREVSIIFDSLDPITRAMAFSLFMHSLHRGTPKTLSPQPWTWALQALKRNMRGDHASNLASVPGHPAEEHYPVPVTPKIPPRRSMFPLRRKPTPECPQTHPPTTVEPPAWTPFRFKSQLGQGPVCETPGAPSSVINPSLEPSERVKPLEEQAADILQNALHILRIGTEPEPEPEPVTPERVSRTLASEPSMDDAYLRIMDWSHNTPFKTNASQAYPSKALTPLQFLLRKSICQPGHLYKFLGAFKNTTLFLFSHLQSSDPILSLAAHATSAAAAATTAFVTESTPMSDLEKEVADDLAIQSLVRVQYKVYLFERILLCCNEINPNKPKNRVLKQPLVDKKGKPKLQLKGRIFMQNVTDVVTLSMQSTRRKRCL